MLSKSRILLLSIFSIVLVTVAPVSAMLAGFGPAPTNVTAEKLVDLAQKASSQVENLIESVNTDEISDDDLDAQLENQRSIYESNLDLLTQAEDAIVSEDYEAAISYAKQALQGFREVYKSVNRILLDAGLKTSKGIDASSLLEAISRSLSRIEHLREILPSEATEQFTLLEQAENLLNLEEAETLIAEGKINVVADRLSQANQLIAEVYQYLKLHAEECTPGRMDGYVQEMERVRERIRERARFAESQGINVNGLFESFGYRNEAEFMNALQNIAGEAEGKINDFDAAIQDLEAMGQMVQQMDNSLTQEINRHQEQYGANGSNSPDGSESSGYGSETGGNSAPGPGSGGSSSSNGNGR